MVQKGVTEAENDMRRPEIDHRAGIYEEDDHPASTRVSDRLKCSRGKPWDLSPRKL
jgi:hypothetical protein